MLLKAWCHYECHILGAFHGLLATYALEVLILYIFQRFNSSLNGPLAVNLAWLHVCDIVFIYAFNEHVCLLMYFTISLPV